jgi:hypothetical protein
MLMRQPELEKMHHHSSSLSTSRIVIAQSGAISMKLPENANTA